MPLPSPTPSPSPSPAAPATPEVPAAPAALERITPEALAAGQRQIPPVAQVLADLQQLLADANTDLEDIAKLIRIDPALAARVVQISNSATFRRGDTCETIYDAVNRIGFREVYHVVAVLGSASIVSHPVLTYRLDANSMWKQSLACAFGAELLAQPAGEDPVAAYLGGLLHGIGRLAVNQQLIAVANATGSGRIKQLHNEGFPLDFSSSEFATLGFTQAEVGAAMLTRWKFFPSVVLPVRHQYDPLSADEPFDRLAAVLYGGRLLRSIVCEDAEPAEIEADEAIFDLIDTSRDEVIARAPKLRETLDKALAMV